MDANVDDEEDDANVIGHEVNHAGLNKATCNDLTFWFWFLFCSWDLGLIHRKIMNYFYWMLDYECKFNCLSCARKYVPRSLSYFSENVSKNQKFEND